MLHDNLYQYRLECDTLFGKKLLSAIATFRSMADGESDDDKDEVKWTLDNCPDAAKSDQLGLDAYDLSDACDPDIDGDGLSDAGEVATFGTDPRRSDSHGDRMPGGYALNKNVNSLDDSDILQN